MSRNKMSTETRTNKRRCTCMAEGCTASLARGEGLGVLTRWGLRFVCVNHRNNYNLLSYGCEDFNERGTDKSTALARQTMGIELEVKNNVENISALRNFLEAHGFIITSDCTVYFEAKSPIYEGLSSISGVLRYIEREGFIDCTDARGVGAHMHTYTSNINEIRNYYHSLFLPLEAYIENMSTAKRVEVFGSDFREYATAIYDGCNAEGHSNIVNVQHSHTIEFRLPRIKSKKQYFEVLKFWREVGCLLETVFNENEILKQRDNESKRARFAIINKTASDIVSIAKKHFN